MADTRDFFENFLREKLASHPELAKEIGAVYVFDVDGAGSWTVDLTEGTGTISEGGHDDPGCTVSAKQKDFEALLDNPNSAMMLFAMGKLKVTNVALAISLQKLLS
ncbi:MAG: hypothetical protein ACI9K2_000342 [Myxococcota bacterium]|jgi:hypothetical protein